MLNKGERARFISCSGQGRRASPSSLHRTTSVSSNMLSVNFNRLTDARSGGASQLSPAADKSPHLLGAAMCRYCCKSPKLPGDNFSALRRYDRRPPICVASIALPRSPVSLSLGDEAPPDLYTKVASTARRIFDHQCKKTFATISASSGLLHRSKSSAHSTTSSARTRRVGGTSRPSALAVLRLITNSYLVGF